MRGKPFGNALAIALGALLMASMFGIAAFADEGDDGLTVSPLAEDSDPDSDSDPDEEEVIETIPSRGKLSSGTYCIESTYLALHVLGASESNARFAAAVGAKTQQWKLKVGKDGYVKVVNVKSGKVLAVKGTAKSGATVGLENDREASVAGVPGSTLAKQNLGQKWVVKQSGSGYELASAYGQYVLTFANSKTKTGYKVELRSKAKKASSLQVFTFTKKNKFLPGKVQSIADGVYVVKNASKSQAFAMTDPNGKTAKNIQMSIKKKDGSSAQRFYVRNEHDGFVSLQSVTSGLFLGDSAGKVKQLADSSAKNRLWVPVWKKGSGYAFVNVGTGKLMSLSDSKVQANVKVVTKAHGKAFAPRWTLAKTTLFTNGYYQLRSAVGTNLAVAWMSYAYNSNLEAYTHHKHGSQMFYIKKRKGDYYQITNAQSFLAVGVQGSSKARKANVVQVKATGASNQLWKPVLQRSGDVVWKNQRSGKVLEVAGSSKKPGANVRQDSFNKKVKGQLWRLQPVSRFSLSGNSTLDHRIANVLRSHGSLASAFNWTVRHSYRNGERYWSNPHVLSNSRTISLANDFFAHGSGNCYRFASAFSWLARGLGYKTNVISGWVQAAGGGRAPHGWVEVYSGGTRICDPDLAHELPGYNWFMCTYGTSPTVYHSW